MVDTPDNIVLTYLRRIDEKVDRIAGDVRDLKTRTTALEGQVGQLMATDQTHYAIVQERLDRVDRRLERIERRLELLPAE